MAELARWTVILHGGCKAIRPADAPANRAGLEAALSAAAEVLAAQGSALDAVEIGIRRLEDDPVFNAGSGSVRRSDGSVEMDAAIMDGDTLDIGGLCVARGLANPITAARGLLREPETLIAGAGPFAAERSPAVSAGPDDSVGVGGDTVGCVALDTNGRIAAGVSTGGLSGARAGRVGDSPLPGCGFYADSQVGGVAATGVGESISRSLLSARVMLGMEGGLPPQEAVEAALRRLSRVGGEAGLIAVDAAGRIGWSHSGDQFAIGWSSSDSRRLHVAVTNLEAADA